MTRAAASPLASIRTNPKPDEQRGMVRARMRVMAREIADGMAPLVRELSVVRASSVLRLFVDAGVPPQRMTATGYGETASGSGQRHSEGRARNRRVTILIESPSLDVPAEIAVPRAIRRRRRSSRMRKGKLQDNEIRMIATRGQAVLQHNIAHTTRRRLELQGRKSRFRRCRDAAYQGRPMSGRRGRRVRLDPRRRAALTEPAGEDSRLASLRGKHLAHRPDEAVGHLVGVDFKAALTDGLLKLGYPLRIHQRHVGQTGFDLFEL